MPLYEFRCDACGAEFEKLVRSSAEGAVVCPFCHASTLTRKLSTFACASGDGGAGSAAACAPEGG